MWNELTGKTVLLVCPPTPSAPLVLSDTHQPSRPSNRHMSTSFLSVASVNSNDRVSLQVFEGQEDWVRCLFSYPDEHQVVSRSADTTFRGCFQ
ncbi:hypothetical protein BDN67DRAFT_974608 [Paxillus ammoniavirescens]|nr:hypothetical protein BDN67DRAFT_974608 [Paxillus ammoniavirescens]